VASQALSEASAVGEPGVARTASGERVLTPPSRRVTFDRSLVSGVGTSPCDHPAGTASSLYE